MAYTMADTIAPGYFIVLFYYRVLTAPAPTAGPKLLTFLNAMEDDARRRRRQSQDSQDGHSFLQRVANILVDLQGLQLALGDPKIQGAVNPEVKAHTEWMINKVNLHTIFNTRTDQVRHYRFKTLVQLDFKLIFERSLSWQFDGDHYFQFVSLIHEWLSLWL